MHLALIDPHKSSLRVFPPQAAQRIAVSLGPSERLGHIACIGRARQYFERFDYHRYTFVTCRDDMKCGGAWSLKYISMRQRLNRSTVGMRHHSAYGTLVQHVHYAAGSRKRPRGAALAAALVARELMTHRKRPCRHVGHPQMPQNTTFSRWRNTTFIRGACTRTSHNVYYVK